MEKEYSYVVKSAGENFINSLKNGEIMVETRPNHGRDFKGGYEQLHKKIFVDYLASSSRYLANKRAGKVKYYG